MKKYFTLFALAVMVIGLAYTIGKDDGFFMEFVIGVALFQILISGTWKD